MYSRINKKNIFYYLLSSFLLLQTGCYEAVEPSAFIHIPSMKLATQLSSEGSATSSITDAYVYVDGLLQGIYPLPATFPVKETGSRQIQIYAGVRQNIGRSEPVLYPFFRSASFTLNLTAGKTDTLRPIVNYLTNTRFHLIDNFEQDHTFKLHNDQILQNSVTTTATGAFEGKSGFISIDKIVPFFTKSSNVSVKLPLDAEKIYIEVDIKNEGIFEIGVLGRSATQVNEQKIIYLGFNPRNNWEKKYIDITNEVKSSQMTDFRVFVSGILPDSLQTARFWFDNIKLIQK